jgi:hypothetical protein
MPKLTKTVTKWFDIPEDECGGRIEVVHLEEADVAEIAAEATKQTFNFTRGKDPEHQAEYNAVVDRDLTVTKAIANWENFYDGKASKGRPYGKELKCTPENRRKFARVPGFMAFLKTCRDELAEEVEQDRKGSEKNSKSGRAG